MESQCAKSSAATTGSNGRGEKNVRCQIDGGIGIKLTKDRKLCGTNWPKMLDLCHLSQALLNSHLPKPPHICDAFGATAHLTNRPQKWYHIDMNNFEKVYETAADRYGLITVEDAADLGIHRKQLLLWEAMGRLERCGRGVYRLNHHVPTPYDHFAEAVALVGRGSLIYGDGVLAMHNLALVNPPQIQVAVAKRVRRALPEWIRLVKKTDDIREESFEGIACQKVADAIRTCRGTVMKERLVEAIDEAARQGLVDRQEYKNLKKEFAK